MASQQEKLLILLKEKYDYEVQRKLYFENILNLPVTLLGFLSGGVIYILNLSDIDASVCFVKIKPFLLIAQMISTFVSIFYVYSVYFDYKRDYKSFPNSDDVQRDFTNQINYQTQINQNLSKKKLNKVVEKALENIMVNWYIDINVHNAGVNDKRGNLYHQAKLAIGISFIISLVSFILATISRF